MCTYICNSSLTPSFKSSKCCFLGPFTYTAMFSHTAILQIRYHTVCKISIPLSTTADSKVSSSNITDKEEVIPLPDSNNQQLNVSHPVSMTTLLHFIYIQNTWVATDNFLTSCESTIKCHRESISTKPNVRLNLWAFVKNSIGKDLSGITLPVSTYVCLCVCVCVCVCACMHVCALYVITHTLNINRLVI